MLSENLLILSVVCHSLNCARIVSQQVSASVLLSLVCAYFS